MKNKIFLISLLWLVQLLCAETYYTDIDDPFFRSPRTTALGMTGVALIDTPEAVFYNPALPTEAKAIQWYGASYTVIDDVRTYHTAVAVPLGRWGLGFGYTTTHVPGVSIIPESLDSVDSQGRPLPDQVKNAVYDRSAVYLSAAFLLAEHGTWLQRSSVGLTLKSFSAQTQGAGLREANASGFNLDLGWYGLWNKVWATGLTFRNVLTSPLHWQSGAQEELPKVVSLGNTFTYNDGGFIVLLDADFYEKKYQPNLLKAGVEVGLTQYLRLRTGLRQYLAARDEDTLVLNGMTAGLGIRPLTDMSIDYAYFPGDGYAQNAIHYAGLSFQSFAIFMPPTGAVVVEEPKPATFKLLAPPDELITENKSVTVQAVVSGERWLTINGLHVPVTGNEFTYQYALVPGVNQLSVSGRELSWGRKIYRLRSYEELLVSAQAKDAAQVVLTKFYRQLPFMDEVITRKEAAEYIAQSLQLPLPTELQAVFSVQDILYLYGIYGSTQVTDLGNASQPLTKGELAVLLARLDGYAYLFTESSAAEPAVEVLASTGYYRQEDFYPLNSAVSRRELIAALARSSKVTQRISNENPGQPIFWINSSYVGCTLYAPNAGLTKVLAQINGVILPVTINGSEYTVFIATPQLASENSKITLNITDRFGNNTLFATELSPLPPVVEPVQAPTLAAVAQAIPTTSVVSANTKPLLASAGQSSVLTKVLPQKVRSGEKLICYVGVMGVPEILSVTCVFADEKIVAVPAAPGLWKAEKLVTKKTAPQYTVLVKTTDGLYTAKGLITIEGAEQAGAKALVAKTEAVVFVPDVPVPDLSTKTSEPVTSAPLVSASAVVTTKEKTKATVVAKQLKPVAILKKATPGQRTPLSVPAYSPEIILGQAYAGKNMAIKVKINMPRIVKVTAEVDNVKTYLTWSKKGYWYGEKNIPRNYAGKKMFVKIYVKDSAGKYSMTEKVTSVR